MEQKPYLLRLRHLADNICKDLELLKDYEDSLRYEIDPRLQAKYRQTIQYLRSSVTHYQDEYNDLRAQITGEPSAQMQDISFQLGQMDNKLNSLLSGQVGIQQDVDGLRQALFDNFSASEQKIMSAIISHLDRDQLLTTQAVIHVIESGHLVDDELKEILDAVKQIVNEFHILPRELDSIPEVIDAPKLELKHKLKMMIPIIPFLLQYEGEMTFNNSLNLESVWRKIIHKVKSK